MPSLSMELVTRRDIRGPTKGESGAVEGRAYSSMELRMFGNVED